MPWNKEACLRVAKRNGHLKAVEWVTTTVRSNGEEHLSNQYKVPEECFQDR